MLIGFLVLASVVLILAGWILIVPVCMTIDTSLDRYDIIQRGLMRFSFHPGLIPMVELRVFGFKINLKRGRAKAPKSADQSVKRRKPKRKKSLDARLYLVRNVLKGFRLKRLCGTIDFNDVVLNAQLYPVLKFASRGVVNLNTNFVNERSLYVRIEVRLYTICWTMIRFLIKK